MIRVCSQLTFCSPQTILQRTVVEQDENHIITGLFSLDSRGVESYHTLFFDGILSSGIVSVKQHFSQKDIVQRVADYHYIDLSDGLPSGKILPNDKPLILDFGNLKLYEINRILASLAPNLQGLTVYDLIASCTFYPNELLGIPAGLKENRYSDIILWEGVDLVNKLITDHTFVRKIE